MEPRLGLRDLFVRIQPRGWRLVEVRYSASELSSSQLLATGYQLATRSEFRYLRYSSDVATILNYLNVVPKEIRN